MILMTVSAVYMMMQTTRSEVNGAEWTFLRGGMSIYAGWMTAATIVSIPGALKFFGFSGFSWYSEEQITITVLYVALVIFSLASWLELNPLYGAIFLWVTIAIR